MCAASPTAANAANAAIAANAECGAPHNAAAIPHSAHGPYKGRADAGRRGGEKEFNAAPGRDFISAPTLLEIIIAPAGPDLSRLPAPWDAHRAADHARRAAVLRKPTEHDELAGYAADWVVIVNLPGHTPTGRMFGRPSLGCAWLAAAHASLDDLIAEAWAEFGRHRACRWAPRLMDAEDTAYVADLIAMHERGEP